LGPLPEGKTKSEVARQIDEFLKLKLTRLEKFYRYGLSQAGWNKYSSINLEFDNQIICKRR
jgi:cell division protein FtsQ